MKQQLQIAQNVWIGMVLKGFDLIPKAESRNKSGKTETVNHDLRHGEHRKNIGCDIVDRH